MNLKTADEALEWCVAQNFAVSGYDVLCKPALEVDIIDAPREYQRAIVLLDSILLQSFSSGFGGALLWIKEWWAISSEAATVELFNRLRASYIVGAVPLEEAPAQVFDGLELDPLYYLTLL